MKRTGAILWVLVGLCVADATNADPLQLTVNLTAESFDWVAGTVNQSPQEYDARWGNIGEINTTTSSAWITSPLADFSRPGDRVHHTRAGFYVSPDGTRIIGITFLTNVADLGPSSRSFSGNTTLGQAAVYFRGDFSVLSGLTPSTYTLPSWGSAFDGDIEVTVVVPDPASITLLSLGGLALLRRC